MPSARSAIVQRIKDNAATLPFDTVRGTSNMSAILRQGWASPACFVYRDSDIRDDNFRHLEMTKSTYMVVIAVETEEDDGSVEDFTELLTDSLNDVLDGFSPLGINDLWYSHGKALTDLKRNLLIWAMAYTLEQSSRSSYAEQ